jgi:hypothetical protein
MTDLKRRLAAIERIFFARRRSHIVCVIIENCPDSLSEDDAESGNLRYHRAPDETVEAFRERASTDAEARGRATIVFGHSANHRADLAPNRHSGFQGEPPFA